MELDELNEQLYEQFGRLHMYEGFMSEKQANEVGANIFQEYRDQVKIYFAERDLEKKKRLFELRELNALLTPFRWFLGLFANKEARKVEEKIDDIEEKYLNTYTLDRTVDDALERADVVIDQSATQATEEPSEEAEEEENEHDVADVGADQNDQSATQATEEPSETVEEEIDDEVIVEDEYDEGDPFIGQMEVCDYDLCESE